MRSPTAPRDDRRDWEVVARYHLQVGTARAASWIVPASEGKRFTRRRVAGWWLARRWTRRAAAAARRSPSGHPPMTFEVRRNPRAAR